MNQEYDLKTQKKRPAKTWISLYGRNYSCLSFKHDHLPQTGKEKTN